MAYAPGPMSPAARGGTMIPPTSLPQQQVAVDPAEGEERQSEPEVEPPPAHTYPCGCPFPGQHKADCMWSLWEQMRDNYLQTKHLMGKFTAQAVSLQEGEGRPQCECPPGCHGRDLGAAMGLQSMRGVTLPWGQPQVSPMGMTQPPGYPTAMVQSDNQRAIEEQRRIKNTWAQFLNIFNMSMDLANDVSRDRWEANKRRKERARLERQERLEEQRRQRQDRSTVTSTASTADKPDKPKKKGEEKPAKEEPKGEAKPKPSKAEVAEPEPEQAQAEDNQPEEEEAAPAEDTPAEEPAQEEAEALA